MRNETHKLMPVHLHTLRKEIGNLVRRLSGFRAAEGAAYSGTWVTLSIRPRWGSPPLRAVWPWQAALPWPGGSTAPTMDSVFSRTGAAAAPPVVDLEIAVEPRGLAAEVTRKEIDAIRRAYERLAQERDQAENVRRAAKAMLENLEEAMKGPRVSYGQLAGWRFTVGFELDWRATSEANTFTQAVATTDGAGRACICGVPSQAICEIVAVESPAEDGGPMPMPRPEPAPPEPDAVPRGWPGGRASTGRAQGPALPPVAAEARAAFDGADSGVKKPGRRPRRSAATGKRKPRSARRRRAR